VKLASEQMQIVVIIVKAVPLKNGPIAATAQASTIICNAPHPQGSMQAPQSRHAYQELTPSLLAKLTPNIRM
jgi:hypothetical protein